MKRLESLNEQLEEMTAKKISKQSQLTKIMETISSFGIDVVPLIQDLNESSEDSDDFVYELVEQSGDDAKYLLYVAFDKIDEEIYDFFAQVITEEEAMEIMEYKKSDEEEDDEDEDEDEDGDEDEDEDEKKIDEDKMSRIEWRTGTPDVVRKSQVNMYKKIKKTDPEKAERYMKYISGVNAKIDRKNKEDERARRERLHKEDLDLVDEAKTKLTPHEAKSILQKHGAHGKDYFDLSWSQQGGLAQSAKESGYRKSRTAYGSTGRMFHRHLTKIASQTNEEVEQIDELKKDTMKSYLNKASERFVYGKSDHEHMKNPSSETEKNVNRDKRRLSAITKVAGKLAKEDVEHINELSSQTLLSYAKKAQDNAEKHRQLSAKASQKASKREVGAFNALKRFSKDDAPKGLAVKEDLTYGGKTLPELENEIATLVPKEEKGKKSKIKFSQYLRQTRRTEDDGGD